MARLIDLLAVVLVAFTCHSAFAEPLQPPEKATPTAEDLQVNTYTTGSQSRPAVALHDTGFVVTWASPGSPDSDTSGSSVHARQVLQRGPTAASSWPG